MQQFHALHSVRHPQLHWAFQSAVQQKAGKIEAAGLTKKVRFELIEGDINNRIDEAYRQKYSKSPYLNSMISSRAKAATVKILAYDA